MKILATADSHFGFQYGRTSEARRITCERMFDAFGRMFEIAKDNEVDLILHGGDMFNRSQPKQSIISKAYGLLERILDHDIQFVGIPGNHDRSILPETLMSHFNKNLHLLNRFSKIKMDQIAVIGFPFEARNPKSILDKIALESQRNPEESIIILCHQLFDGAVFGPHMHKFTNRRDTLDSSILPKNVKFVVSGHIHRAQTLQKNRVYYTGSLERTSFMEIVEPKGFLLIDIEEGFYKIDFIEIDSFPMDIIEIELERDALISSCLNKIRIEDNIRTQIRFTGKKLSEKEIKFIWANFPAKDYPYLTFSPKKPNIKLRSLYSETSIPFEIKTLISF